MRLTYNEALASIIEHTEMGYTIASQDRLWIVFTFDFDSDGDYADFRYNRLYPMIVKDTGVTNGWAYDHDMDHEGRAVPLWTSRAEAEHFASDLRAHLARIENGAEMADNVYVMNLGDDARFEAQIIGRDNGTTVRDHPKYKGSEAAWKAMAEMGLRWSMWAAEREQADEADAEGSCP